MSLSDIETRLLTELAKHPPGAMVSLEDLRRAVGLDATPADQHKFDHFSRLMTGAGFIERYAAVTGTEGRFLLASKGQSFLIENGLI